ncbi:MAG: tryptophan-rich sensory protein [Patescibacteria group bacterium]|nr:tryptophan-rich sensory protein [Patescibacteria group bacterium]
MKLSYVVIPFLVLLVAVIGSWITKGGMLWYESILLPSWTPPGWVISVVWSAIFVLAAWAAVLTWEKKRNKRRPYLIGLFALNGLLNIGWSYLFFGLHDLAASFGEMMVLEATVLLLLDGMRTVGKKVAYFLLPYALWVPFATALTYEIIRLNS